MKQLFTTLALALVTTMSFAQVGIGTTTPDASAILDINVDNLPANAKKGLLPPRMSTGERDAIASPAEGLTIYNTTNKCIEFWNATNWISACDGSVVTLIQSGACIGQLVEFKFNGLTYKPIEAAGKCWLDRNLGATAVTASKRSDYANNNDYITAEAASFGDLYQWGRGSDGHESRSSGLTSTNATTPVLNGNNAWDGLFILEPSAPFDWLQTQDPTLWQPVTGVNNPCPAGYRLPTNDDLVLLDSSFATQNSDGAYASPLKLPVAGNRDSSATTGPVINTGVIGHYWSSGVVSTGATYLSISGNDSSFSAINRALGFSVRCIKN